ncbi:hypothetical protein CR513_24461, partial [Mucuna pruriens]
MVDNASKTSCSKALNATHEPTCTGGPKQHLWDTQFLGSIKSEAHDTVRNYASDWRGIRSIDFSEEVFEVREGISCVASTSESGRPSGMVSKRNEERPLRESGPLALRRRLWLYSVLTKRKNMQVVGALDSVLKRSFYRETGECINGGCTSLLDHLNEFQGIIDQMSGMDIKFEDEILGLLLLNYLPEFYDTFKVSITNSVPNGIVSLQMIKGSVLNKKMRRKAQDSSSQSEVLVTENKGRNQKKERKKSRSKSKSRYKNENKGKKDKSKEKDDDDDDDHVTSAIGDNLVILRDFKLVNLISDESMWIIDSDDTLHVTLRKEFLTSYTLGGFGVLKMGNNGVIKVIDVGDVFLQTNIGMQLWPRGVKHAPNVRFNLISVHMLDDSGYDNHFGYGKWKHTIGNLVMIRGEKISKLYWTKALVAKDSVNVMDKEASLWHRRLSHISEKVLNCLAKKDMLPGLKNAELEKCSHYMAGKQTRVSFKKHPPSRKSELLELVHSNVCGPLKVKSFSGALYFVTFIDDCSRKLWVYTLKSNDQVLENFKHFQALVERQPGKKVKCIRSDNGDEYCGPFDVYCKQKGIRHEKTHPKTPQLNGLVERMNRTLIERDRCMLSEASPVVALTIEVPNKIWFGKDVKMSDLVEKKLFKSRDVQFIEDQTIEDIDKSTLEKDNNLSEIDPV